MGEFFKGWRRKMGVMTLLMACVLMAGWVRSRFVGDEINDIPIVVRTLTVKSEAGGLEFASWPNGFSTFSTQWTSWPITDDGIDGWHWTEPPFRFGIMNSTQTSFQLDLFNISSSRRTFVGYRIAFRYWSIVIPLTLLSTWLLLSKPRVKKTPEKQG